MRLFSLGLIAFIFLISSCGVNKTLIKEEGEDYVLSKEDRETYNYLFNEALKQKTSGNIKQAILYYQQCIQLNPGSDASFYELSRLFLFLGDKGKALEYAIRADNIDKENIWYKYQLAGIYGQLGLKDQSIGVYNELCSMRPGNLELRFQLANLYLETAKYDEALEIYNEIEKSTGINEAILLKKIFVFREKGMDREMELEMSRLLQIGGDDISNMILYGEVLNELGKKERAGRLYDSLMIEHPSNEALNLSLINFYLFNDNYDDANKLARSILLDDKIEKETKFDLTVYIISNPEVLDKFGNEFEQSLELFSKKYREDNRIIALKGDYYVKKGEYDSAAIEFIEYLERDKKNYLVWEQLLFIFNVLGETDSLYLYSNSAISYFPEAPLPYFFKALACSSSERSEEAVRSLESGLIYADGNNELLVQFYMLLGETYHSLFEHEKSDSAFELALRIDVDNIVILNNYSYYLSVRGERLDEALEMSRKCIEREPKNTTYLDTYGWILFKMGKFRKAEKYIGKAVETDKSPEILEHYGDVVYRQGKRKKAVQYWRMAIKNGGDKERIGQKLNNDLRK